MSKTGKTSMHLYDNDMLFWRDENRQMDMAVRIQSDDEPMNPREEFDNHDIMFCCHPRYTLGDSLPEKTPGKFWASIISEHMNLFDIAAKLLEQDAVRGYASDILDKCRALSRPALELGKELVLELTEDFLDYIREEDAVGAAMDVSQDDIAALPLWLYDHSGITMSCGDRTYPYNDQWDSSAIGWIVVPKSVAMCDLTCPVDRDGNPCLQNPADYVTSTDSTWKYAAIKCMQESVRIYDQYLQEDVYGYTVYERPAESMNPDGEPNRSDESEWTEVSSCWGFFGSDVSESGILDDIGYGLDEALKSNQYKTGTAKSRTIVTWQFCKNA